MISSRVLIFFALATLQDLADIVAAKTCGVGHYQAQSRTDYYCIPCDPGKYADSESTTPTWNAGGSSGTKCPGVCDAGKFAGTGKSSCSPCDAGQYQAETAKGSCIACSAGKYATAAEQTSQSVCISCLAGRYSGGAAASSPAACSACAKGRYATAGAGQTSDAACIACGTGKHSSGTAQTSSSTCIPCAAGRYAWQLSVGHEDDSNCESCAAGKYSTAGTGQTDPSVCISCNAGRYSSSGLKQTSPSVCIDCPAGTYVASAAQTSCISCLKGQYSASGAAQTAAAVCVNCSPGQYSTSGAGQASVTVCQACAGGKYSISGAAQTSPGVCISCAQGHYSPSKGQATANACIACIPGKYSSAGVGQANESSCSNCAAGKYSAAAAQTSSTSCKPCMKGTYGRPVGLAQITCISCPIGKYSALTGQVDASTCVGCGRGKYASSGTAQTSSAICIDCRAGQFSDVDIPTQCAKCAQGSYNNEAGKSKCKICNEGEGRTWTRLPGAVNSSSCVAMVGQKCPKHFQQEDPRLGICVCEAGAVRSTPNGACSPCPSGTFRPANSEDSLACQRCPPGSWSAEQASTCNICPSGTFNAKAGATSPSSCIPCTNSTRNGTCPAGSGAPLTDMAAQALEVARKISSAGKIDQTIDDTITAAAAESSGGNGGGGGDGDGGDGGDRLADILNEHVMYISTSSMVTLALITIALHWLFPACFYSRVDVFHLDHVIDEGESPVRRRTQLGSAFTVAFLPVVVVAALVLIRANNNVVTEALSLPMDQVAAKTAMFRVRVTSPFAFGNVTAGGCDEGITLAPASIEGIRCESPTELSWSPKDCMLEGRRCTIGEDAKLGFKVSMDYKAVSFSAGSVTPRVEGGKPAGDGQLVVLNGTVASPSGDQVLAGSTVVRLQLLATYVQDNTSSAALFWQRDTESSNENIQTGYQLSPRPHVRALTVSSQQGVTATSSWDLEIQIQRLPTALKTVITRGQDTVQLLAAILTLAATLFAIWRRVFGEFEDFVKLCQRKISCCRPRSNKAKASGAIELVEDPQEATRNTCSNSSSSSSSSSNSIPERLQVVSGGSADSAGSKALTAGNERTSTNIGAEGPSYAASAGDWTKQQDPTSGQDYYFNERTRATTWTDPDSKQDVVNPMFQGVAPASDASNTPLELKKRLGRAEQEIKEMRAKIAQADERASKAEQRLAAIEAALRTDSQRQRKSD